MGGRELLTTSFLPARWGNRQQLLALRALRGVRWTVQFGPSPLTVLSLAQFGATVATRFGDLALARRCARWQRRCWTHQPWRPIGPVASCLSMPCCGIGWIPIGRRLRRCGRWRGRPWTRATCAWRPDATGVYINHACLAGLPLPELLQESGSLIDGIARFAPSPSIALQLCRLMRRQLINLVCPASAPLQMSGDGLDEGELLAQLVNTGSRLGLATFHYLKLYLSLSFAAPEAALHHAELLLAHIDALRFTIVEPDAYALAALAQAPAYGAATGTERRRLLQQIDVSLARLRRWAVQTPVNQRHRYLLVSAARGGRWGAPPSLPRRHRRRWNTHAARVFWPRRHSSPSSWRTMRWVRGNRSLAEGIGRRRWMPTGAGAQTPRSASWSRRWTCQPWHQSIPVRRRH